MKLISMSIWVNSGWRSARRSSSRKQRTIWKYRSKPEIMRRLLELLGRLRQGVERPCGCRRGDEEVAGALGRRSWPGWASRSRGSRSRSGSCGRPGRRRGAGGLALHLRTAQVEVAVFEAQLLGGRGGSAMTNGGTLDAARILSVGARPRPRRSGSLLTASGARETRRARRRRTRCAASWLSRVRSGLSESEDDLGQALAVAEVDEERDGPCRGSCGPSRRGRPRGLRRRRAEIAGVMGAFPSRRGRDRFVGHRRSHFTPFESSSACPGRLRPPAAMSLSWRRPWPPRPRRRSGPRPRRACWPGRTGS